MWWAYFPALCSQRFSLGDRISSQSSECISISLFHQIALCFTHRTVKHRTASGLPEGKRGCLGVMECLAVELIQERQERILLWMRTININNIIYVCYCLFPFPRRNVPFSGWTKVEVLFSIISSYDIMLHLNSCSWSSHFRWTYNPFLARLDMPGVSRSLEVYCCHWLFANSKEIGAWKDWAGVGADVLRWRNQQPYWGYWGLCLYPLVNIQKAIENHHL